MAKAPITQAQRDRMAEGRPFSHYLPLDLGRDRVVTSIQGNCSGCGEAVADSHSRMHHSEPLPGVHTFDGYVCCPSCRLATPILIRVMPDGRLEGPDPASGAWRSWRFLSGARTPAWWNLLGWLRRVRRALATRRA